MISEDYQVGWVAVDALAASFLRCRDLLGGEDFIIFRLLMSDADF